MKKNKNPREQAGAKNHKEYLELLGRLYTTPDSAPKRTEEQPQQDTSDSEGVRDD